MRTRNLKVNLHYGLILLRENIRNWEAVDDYSISSTFLFNRVHIIRLYRGPSVKFAFLVMDNVQFGPHIFTFSQ